MESPGSKQRKTETETEKREGEREKTQRETDTSWEPQSPLLVRHLQQGTLLDPFQRGLIVLGDPVARLVDSHRSLHPQVRTTGLAESVSKHGVENKTGRDLMLTSDLHLCVHVHACFCTPTHPHTVGDQQYIIKTERNEPGVRAHHLGAETHVQYLSGRCSKTVSGKHDRGKNTDNPKVEGNQTKGRQPHRIV